MPFVISLSPIDGISRDLPLEDLYCTDLVLIPINVALEPYRDLTSSFQG